MKDIVNEGYIVFFMKQVNEERVISAQLKSDTFQDDVC